MGKERVNEKGEQPIITSVLLLSSKALHLSKPNVNRGEQKQEEKGRDEMRLK